MAQELGIKYYDHEIIERAASQSSMDESYFEHVENNGYQDFMYNLSVDIHHDLSMNDRVYLQQAKTIRDIAKEGPCVIVGRCADYVLKDRQKVIKVFIYADIEQRRKRIQDLGQTVDNIEKTDQKRASYYSYYTGRKFGDMTNYDICLNSSMLGIEGCVKIIKAMYKEV